MDEDLPGEEPTHGPRREEPVSEGDGMVVFDIGEYLCGARLHRVREIVPMCELTRPPGLPPLLEGLLNLRGEMTPVVRTERLFDLPPIHLQRYTQLIVLRWRTPLALLSDRVRDIITVAPPDLLPAPKDSVFNRCLEAVVSTGRGPIHLLSMDRLFLIQEEQRISELQQMAQSRLARLEAEA